MSMDAMKKSVNVLSSTTVRPSDETPTRILWLSRLDMMVDDPYLHSQALYVYQVNETQNTKPLSSTSFFDTETLKKSLGKALVPFYPMAGRLQINKSNDRYEINCNAEGVLFIEAETLCSLTDVGDKTKLNTEFIKQLFCPCDYSKGLSSMPLLMVQLTRFKCGGGVCLGISQHHHVGDGQAYSLLTNSWARLAQGFDVDVTPVHDRFKYLAARDPPQLQIQDSDFNQPYSLPPLALTGTKSSITKGEFMLSKGHINTLKQESMSSQNLSSSYKVTTFNVVAGHVWRSVCKARNLSDDQDVKLYIPVDGRQILKNPELPTGYIGNVTLCAMCEAKAGDIMHKPLWYAVSKICEAIAKIKDSEFFRSTIDYIETQPDLEPLVRREHNFGNPNLWINSWVRMTFNDANFGWGAPKLVRPGRVRFEGHSGFHAGGNDGSMSLSIVLFSVHLTAFKKHFYESQADLTPGPNSSHSKL